VPPAFDVLIVEMGGQRYGLPAASVRELARAVTILQLPGAPPIVEGVIDVRGQVVPVLDARARLGLPPRALAHTDHLVLAWAGARAVALRVDRALELVRVEADAVERLADRGHVAGVVKLPDGLVLIQDLDALLSAGEEAAIDRALPGGGE
jgi:purine-binding chemotaxis protein CheW